MELQKVLEQLPSFQQIKITAENFELVDKYPHIEVSLEEVFYAVQNIKHKKNYELKMAQLEKRFVNWTAAEYWNTITERLDNMVRAKKNDFEANYIIEKGKNYEILAFMCYYFANAQSDLLLHSETNNIFLKTPTKKLSTDKGILLMGNTGRSKTLLLKSFCQNPRKSYAFIEAKYIRDDYKQRELTNKATGVDATNYYSSDFKTLGPDAFNQKTYDLCIDDFGVEEPVNVYGEKVEPVLDVIMNRLNLNLTTHITTNLTFEEIEKRYGSRVISRFEEQMNILFFPKETPDYRKL